MGDYQFDTTTIIAVGIGIAIMVALVIWQIVAMFRRKNAGANMLAIHPDAARVYVRLGGPMAGTLKMATGMQADVSINSIDNKACGYVLDASGGFTPVLPGPHTLRVTATISRPGFKSRLIADDLTVELVSYQCIFVGYDMSQKGFYIQELTTKPY
jgi:hypothetical protein